ncbi:MAG: PEP-CTERM sorting domain-containing protein [Porticoccus sp.]|jgi:hypothetical protein|uniref:PEP-CTERM sorting domain-containing protein n=1 Tax=Porticoccus sp. TaxID=2024853 RepID=UPI0032987B1F
MSLALRSRIPSLLLASSLLFTGGNASAALLDAFENGGFEGYTGNTNGFNSDVPPGWTTTEGTPDVFNASTNFRGFSWKASSTGGDFLHGIGWDGRAGSPYVESALQVGLGGLVIGQQYEISFEQSISHSDFSEAGGYWEIIFGAESQNAATMELPTFGEAADWIWQTLIFTATSEIQTLEVVAHSTFGDRADLGIDSFFLGDPGTNPDNPDTPTDPTPPTALPVPGSLPLLGLGLGALLLVARRQRQS